ncbi:MAG: ABC transporter substrate-binding protein [Chloroflexota bacterium]|nr:ABC transporter substrate-binding protein [Chloroflexota bacterium]
MNEPTPSATRSIGQSHVETRTRRQILRAFAAAGGTAALASVLAACGGGSTPTATSAPSASANANASAPATSPTRAAASGSAVATGAAPAAAIPPTGTAAQVQRGGTLTWAYTLIPTKLDPVWSQARTDQLVLAQVVEGLVRNSRESTIEAAVADKWTVSSDGLTYTFHLRPGVKFHNGAPVTPEDVIASLTRAKNNGSNKWMLAEATSIAKVDDATVNIVLNTKVASFLARMAFNSNAIFPKTEIDKIGTNEFMKPIGTGPFMVQEWVVNDHLTLNKNPNWWQMGVDGKPQPYLDQLLFKQVAESTTQVLQVQAGSLNGSEGIPWSQIQTLEKDSRGQLLTFPQQQVNFMVLRLDKPPFDDLKVRQAMSLALDRKVFVDRATAGKATIGNSFFAKDELYWDPNATLPYDLEKAKQLIAQSKYPNGHSGATLQLTSGSQIGRDNATIAKDMWDKIGIHLTIAEVEGSTLSDGWYKGSYEAISGYQWTNGILDPEQHVVFFCVTPRMNTAWMPDQHTTDLATAASQELDPNKRRQMYTELQGIYNDQVGGTITLNYTPSVNYLSPNVKGFFRTPLGVPLYRDVWLGK